MGDENDRDNLLIDEDALYGLGPENGSDWLQEGMRNALLPPPASGASDWMKAGMAGVGDSDDVDGLMATRANLGRASGYGQPPRAGIDEGTNGEDGAARHEALWQEAEAVAARWIRQNNLAMDEYDTSLSDNAKSTNVSAFVDDEKWLAVILKDVHPEGEAEDSTRAYPRATYVGAANPETGKQEDRTGKLTLGDGTEYLGGFVNGLRHGEGTMVYADGSKYQGSWVRDKRHGNGALVRPDGSSYAGEWLNDMMEGAGRWAWPTGHVGDVIDGAEEAAQHTVEVVMHAGQITEFNGKPPVSFKDEPGEYEGTGPFIVGQGAGGVSFTGTGTVEYSNGDSYSGEWKDGVYDGQGTFVYPDGLGTYEGSWRAGERDGQGTMTYARSGNSFSGTWIAGKRDGEGILTWANGTQYDGGWKDDVMSGVGTLTRADGSWKKSEYENGRPVKLLEEHEVEQEEPTAADGGGDDEVDGADLDGLLARAIGDAISTHRETGLPLQGHHTVSFAIGDVYEGEWVNGRRHGKGKETVGIKGDVVYEGEWINNMRHGQGKLTYYNIGFPAEGGRDYITGGTTAAAISGHTSSYEGGFKADKKHGIGVFTYSDGTWVKAMWENGTQTQGEPLEMGGFVLSREGGDHIQSEDDEAADSDARQPWGRVVAGQGVVCGGVAETPAETVTQSKLEREINALGEKLMLMSQRVAAGAVDQDVKDRL